MRTRCRTCRHPRRPEIEADLTARRPLREIEEAYRVSRGSVSRHARAHMPALLVREPARRSLSGPAQLCDEMRALHGHTLELLRALHSRPAAETDARLLFAAVREIRHNIEAFARLQGTLPSAEAPDTAPGRLVDQLVQTVTEALQPHPEAARAVAARLLALDEAPHA